MSATSVSRPVIIEDEHLFFLDELRETCAANMFGACPYLVEEFDVTEDEAEKILMYWMKTFSARRKVS